MATGDDLLRQVERDLEGLRRRLAPRVDEVEFHSQRAELEMLQAALRPIDRLLSSERLHDVVETCDTAIDELRRLDDPQLAGLIERLELRRVRCLRRLRAYRQVGVE